MVKGNIFQAEFWSRHPSVGVHFGLLWLRKMEKEKAKELKRKKSFLAHLFMKMKENMRKGR